MAKQLDLPKEDTAPAPADLSFITDVFGEGGLLSQRFPNYKPRPGQIEMVEAVARTVLSKDVPKTLMVDAPCGSGKSWAYIIPAVWWLSQPLDELDTMYDEDLNQMPRKVVVATANIALQDQLIGKDLPALREVLPWPFTYAVAKGLSNYACKDKLHDLQTSVFAESFHGDEERQYRQVVEWEKVTEKGDVSELPEELSTRVRLAVTQTPEECTGRRCGFAEQCHALKARERFRKADVVVTNYHLLAADAQSEHRILPPHSLLIGDEAHAASDVFRSCIGSTATSNAFKRASMSIPKGDPLREELVLALDEFFGALRTYAKDVLRDEVVLFEPDPDIPIKRLDGVCKTIQDVYEEMLRGGSLSPKERQLTSARNNRLGELRSLLEMVRDPTQAKGYVVFVEQDERRIGVSSRLVDPADFIRDNVLRRPHLRAAVLTSATMCTTPNDFGHISREVGALDSEDISVESPFDLAKNVLIVVPEKLPDPKERTAPEKIAQLVLQVAQLARGRTLGLFTSYRVLRASADVLRASWSHGEVLVQGSAPRGQLVRRFKEQEGSVLLGTSSLWEGVDVPGEALSCVVVDKLPFPSPKDPVMQKLQERDPKGSFKRDAMPRALRAWRQGAGRLIRSEIDRGVIVCLDPRIVDRGYGTSFLRTMLGVCVSRQIADVENFLEGRPLTGMKPSKA